MCAPSPCRGAPVHQGLHRDRRPAHRPRCRWRPTRMYNEFKPADVAHFQKFFDLFSEKGIFTFAPDGRLDALQGLNAMASHLCRLCRLRPPSPGCRQQRYRRADCCSASPRWARALPLIGPLVLFIVWDLAVRFGFIKAILLPAPAGRTGRAGRRPGRRTAAERTSCITVWRTVQAFLIAAAWACRWACCWAAPRRPTAALSS